MVTSELEPTRIGVPGSDEGADEPGVPSRRLIEAYKGVIWCSGDGKGSRMKTRQRKSDAAVDLTDMNAAKQGLPDLETTFTCRICFEESRDASQLISPCLCKGGQPSAEKASETHRARLLSCSCFCKRHDD